MNGAPPSIDSLSTIVQEHSKQFITLHKEIADVGDRVATLFGQLSNKMDTQRSEAYAEQQRSSDRQIAAAASNKPDYKGYVTIVLTGLSVFISIFVVVGSMAIGPLKEAQISLKEDLKITQDLQQRRNLAMDAANTKVSDDLVTSRLALAFASGEQTAWHEQYLKDDLRHTTREDSIDSQQVKRPEIFQMHDSLKEAFTLALSGLNDRTNSVISSVNELRRQFGDNFTMGDALKALETWRNSFTTPPPAAPR